MTENKEGFEDFIAQGCEQMGISLCSRKLGLFKNYYLFLLQQNKKHNLTSIQGEKEVAVKHFLDSLTCAKIMDKMDGKVIDLGSGAGFPGVPLKIYYPNIQLMLVDSVRKKVEFLNDLLDRMEFFDALAIWDRAENIGVNPQYREKADIVVSRAVASLNVLAELCLPLVKVGGCFIAMKGPGIEQELEQSKKAVSLLGGSIEKLENFTLPILSDKRTLVLIRKQTPTPAGYPRRAGMPAKRPI